MIEVWAPPSGTSVALAQAQSDVDNAIGIGRVLRTFAGASGGAYAMLGLDGTTYSLVHGLASNRFAKYDLHLETGNAGSYSLHQLDSAAVALALFGNSTFTRTGTFTTNVNAAAFGGNYYYTTTAADTATFTTRTGAKQVGVRTVYASNGGLWKVAIDADTTLANLLPTAQNVVDAGIYANTILVANGGTLNPTDRVLDCFLGSAAGAQLDIGRAIADNLNPGAHAITLTATGYIASAGSTGRCYISGFADSDGTMTPSTAGAWLYTANWINRFIGSAWEDAAESLPAGATTPTFVGNVHGYESEDSITVTVAGAVAPTTGQIKTATGGPGNVTVTRVSHLLHPDTGSTSWANKTVVYTVDRTGLRLDVTYAVLVPTVISKLWSMCPTNKASTVNGFDRGALLNYPSNLTFTAAGDVFSGSSKSAAGWVWQSAGTAGMLLWLPDIYGFTDNWVHASSYSQIEDRGTVNPACTKVYIPAADGGGTSISLAAGGSKSWTTRYLMGYFPQGADTVLSSETPGAHTDASHTDGPHKKYHGQTGTLNDLVAAASNTMQVANDAWVGKIIPSKSFTVAKFVWFTGSASSGNYDVAILDAGGNALWRKGSTAWPSINTAVVETVSPGVAIVAGTPIYVVFAHDNTTGTIRAVLPSFAEQTMDDTGAKLAMRFATSFPIPSALTLSAGASSNRVPHIMLRSA